VATVVWHRQAEDRLLAMSIGRVQTAWGRRVLRLDLRHWCVEGGPPLPLLPAIDATLGEPDAEDAEDGCRFPPDYRVAVAAGLAGRLPRRRRRGKLSGS
jgi:hypothetical protein